MCAGLVSFKFSTEVIKNLIWIKRVHPDCRFFLLLSPAPCFVFYTQRSNLCHRRDAMHIEMDEAYLSGIYFLNKWSGKYLKILLFFPRIVFFLKRRDGISVMKINGKLPKLLWQKQIVCPTLFLGKTKRKVFSKCECDDTN